MVYGFNAHTEPPANPVPGTDAAIFAMAVQPDEHIVIGGAFTANAQSTVSLGPINAGAGVTVTTPAGTSAVAPLWAVLLALINESLGTNVGYVNALLYSAKVEPTFHDITSGSNGDYSAGKGWDACTGLGSPNGAALMAALRGE